VAVDQQRDACPVCGTNVESVLAYDVGAGRPSDRPVRQQSRECPTCRTRLRRMLGEAWKAVARDWRVTLRGGDHDIVQSSLANAGFLTHSQSLTMTAEGVGPGEYEAEVSAVTEQDARDAVTGAVGGQQVEIVTVEPGPATSL
jgi:hypothetical protein